VTEAYRRGMRGGMSGRVVSAHDVAAFILAELGTMTTFKLHKLLYYAQGYSLAWDGFPLFDEKIKAYENGPVVTVLFNEHRGARNVARWPQGDASKLSDEQADTVRAVLELHGHRSAEELVDLTHGERPWVEARKAGKSNEVIGHESLRAFFTDETKTPSHMTPEARAMAERIRRHLGS
jgi:uncharacterized phage-associated protein